MNTQTCVICLRPLTGYAVKPCWTFDGRGACLGRSHASHQYRTKALDGRLIADWHQHSVEDARFYVWLRFLEPIPKRGGHAFHAHRLGFETDPARREELLEWWEHGPLGYHPLQIASIKAEYAALQRRYQAWLTLSRAAAAG